MSFRDVCIRLQRRIFAMGFFLAVLLLGSDPSNGQPAGCGQVVEGPEHRGDCAYHERASGFLENGTPDPKPIDAAIAAYEEALAATPGNLRLTFKLLDALYFKGYYVLDEKRQQRDIYQRLVDLTQKTLEQVAEQTGAGELEDLTLEKQAELLRSVPEAAKAHYWAITSWGLWGTTHSPLKALSQGVGTKIRDHSRLLILIDEHHQDAAGLRMLGRMHTEAPKVPWITGWIDRQEGLTMLRRAVELSPHDPRNLLFLAEAILDYDRSRRDEAMKLLRDLASRQPTPQQLVEHSESLDLARKLLAELTGG